MSLYPLMKEEAGHTTWKSMHHRASLYSDTPTDKEKRRMKEFIYESLSSVALLCNDCRKHIHDYLKNNSIGPALENKQSLSKYLCDFHNDVNLRTGKEVHDCTKILRAKEEAHECKDCTVKVVKQDETTTTPTEINNDLKQTFDKFKEVSVKILHSLCDRYKIPYPDIKFHECPGNPLNSCTSLWIDKRTQDILETPIIYLHPNVFGLRTIVHEFFHYIKQLKKDNIGGLDEHEVEKQAQSIINQEFPFDTIDTKDLQFIPKIKINNPAQIIRNDDINIDRLSNFPISSKIYNKYLANLTPRKAYSKENESQGDLVLDMFRPPSLQDEVQQQTQIIENMETQHAQQLEEDRNNNLFSFLDGIYSPIASIFGMKATDLNQLHTPMILSNATLAITKTYLSPIGALLTTALTSLGIFGALAFSKNSLSYGDKLVMNNFGANFLWNSLDYMRPENKDDIIEGALALGNTVAQQEWEVVPQILMGDYLADLIFNFGGAAETSQINPQSAVRAAQRAQGAIGRAVTGGGGNTISTAAINRRQEMADLRNLQREMEIQGNSQERGRPVLGSSRKGGNPADFRRGGVGRSGTTYQGFETGGAVVIPSDDEEVESSFGVKVSDGKRYATTYDSYAGDATGLRRNTIRDVFHQDPMYDNFNDVYYEEEEYYG